MQSRRLFVSGFAFTGIVGCAGGGAALLSNAARKTAAGSQFQCPDGCISPPPYKHKVTQATSNNAVATALYNVPTSINGSGAQGSTATFTGTISSTVNSDGSVTKQTQIAPIFKGAPSVINTSHTIPSTIPSSGTTTYVDSYGITHTVTTTTSGSAITVTDAFTYKGAAWTFTASSPDGNAVTVSWSSPGGSGSTTLQLPALACSAHHPVIVASVETVASDIGFRDGAELANQLCCICLARQASIANDISQISGGLAILAGLTGIGLAAVPFLSGYAALVGIYGGVMDAIHTFSCGPG